MFAVVLSVASITAMAGGSARGGRRPSSGNGFGQQQRRMPKQAAAKVDITHAVDDLLRRSVHLSNVWERMSMQVAAFDAISSQTYASPSSMPDAGLGLFASRAIPEHSVAAFYPIDAIGIAAAETTTLTIGDENDAYFGDLSGSPYRVTLSHHSLGKLGDDELFIDANPNLVDRPGWLGHRANDAACIGLGDDTDEQAIVDYYTQGTERSNVVLAPFGDAAPIMCLWTTRAIEKGEELFFIYGHDYWITRQGQKMPPISKPVLEALRKSGWKQAIKRAVTELQPARYPEEIELLEGIMGSRA